MTTKQKLTLVLGGNGKTGRRVAQRLTARGAPIRVSSRSGEPPFDWNDRATWAPTLPFVDADDIADVAVAALTDDRHVGEVYELTGPRLLTFAEAIEEIAKATRRTLRYLPIPVEQYTAVLAEHGVPAEFVSLIAYLFTEVLDGRNSRLADGVQRALGRPSRDFSDYARAAASAGVWTS